MRPLHDQVLERELVPGQRASFSAIDSGRPLEIELLSFVRGARSSLELSCSARLFVLKVSANTWSGNDQHTSHEGALCGLSRTPQHFHLQRLHPSSRLTEDASPTQWSAFTSRSTVPAWPVARLERRGEGGKENVRRASKGVSDASEQG